MLYKQGDASSYFYKLLAKMETTENSMEEHLRFQQNLIFRRREEVIKTQ